MIYKYDRKNVWKGWSEKDIWLDKHLSHQKDKVISQPNHKRGGGRQDTIKIELSVLNEIIVSLDII